MQKSNRDRSPAAPIGPRRTLRVAHMTDMHIEPEKGIAGWAARALEHAHAMPDRPDFILQTGDIVGDSLCTPAERVGVLWKCVEQVLADHCRLPIEHCIGNHDVFGWNRAKSRATGSEPNFGKRWVMEQLKLDHPYRSFDRAGWHFVVLDSTHSGSGKRVYHAGLDEEQFEWLEGDLAAVDPATPVLVASHIPILSACAYFDGDNEKTANWVVPGEWMHLDARRIKDLFVRHPNVKVCVSGHIHLHDRCEYAGVTYLCNGAVCGNWWKGHYDHTPPGYAVMDLFDDGSFTNEYITYGWEAQNQ